MQYLAQDWVIAMLAATEKFNSLEPGSGDMDASYQTPMLGRVIAAQPFIRLTCSL
jgi:hypothetical protein